MFGLLVIIGALCSLSALFYTLYLWRDARRAIAQERQREVAFTIPILGEPQSGKTSLLAGIGQYFNEEISDLLKEEQLSVRLLSPLKEEKVRGRTLDHVDLNSPLPLDSERDLPRPGRRTTQAMIAIGRAALEGDDRESLTELHEPERAYFYSHLDVETSAAEYLWCVNDVPGDHFIDEASYESNLFPALREADGLIITLDGPRLSAQGEHRRSDYARHQQVVERFTQLNPQGTIWVVITKVDQLGAEEERDLETWRTLVFQSLIPALRLADDERVCLSLTSAHRSDEAAWREVGALGVELLRGLSRVARARRDEQERHQLTTRRAWRGALASLVALIISGWMGWGVYEYQRLPSLAGEIQWDWDSLETASAPYLRERAHLERSLYPISLYRAEVMGGLATLRSAYLSLFTGELSRWASHISTAQSVAESADAERRLEVASRALKRFHQELTRWERLNLAERALLKQVSEAREVARRWSALEARPQSLKESFALLGRYKLGTWGQRCADQRPAACELKTWFERAQLKLLEHTLQLARARSAEKSARLIQAQHNLEPLLQWRAAYDQLRPNLSSVEERDALIQRAQALLKEAWGRAWSQLQRGLKEGKVERSWRRGVSQLRALRTFENQRRALEVKHQSSLPMPAEIAKAWRDRINIAGVQISEDRQAPDHTMSQAQQAELADLVSWAQVFLDAKRAARVKLREQEQRWLRALRQSFKADQVSHLDQSLSIIARDLDELSAIEGRLEIATDLELWRSRLTSLKTWRAPHQVTLQVSELSCRAESFAEHKINVDGLSIWDADVIEYYLVIHSEGQPIATSFGDDDQSIIFKWSPWMPLSVSTFEQDGHIDHLTQGDERESDDDQVGKSVTLGARYLLPQGEIKINAEGVCSAKVTSTDPTPQWLSELALLADRRGDMSPAQPQTKPKADAQSKGETSDQGAAQPSAQPQARP